MADSSWVDLVAYTIVTLQAAERTLVAKQAIEHTLATKQDIMYSSVINLVHCTSTTGQVIHKVVILIIGEDNKPIRNPSVLVDP